MVWSGPVSCRHRRFDGCGNLTRYRCALTEERTREVQRLHGLLEDAGIKLSVFVSDITGTSARRMLAALVGGERDPQILAGFAQGRMRPKILDLQRALTGNFADHNARLLTKMLAHIDELTATVAELTAEIDAEITPFQQARERLTSIPGVSNRVAEVIIAETGADMTRFTTPQQLASWAVCPGNNESAGRQFSGRTRKGNRWLRGALGEAAAAAGKSKSTYLSARYRRIAARRGPNAPRSLSDTTSSSPHGTSSTATSTTAILVRTTSTDTSLTGNARSPASPSNCRRSATESPSRSLRRGFSSEP